MFDNISRKYDFLNHSLSLGIDRSWRRKTINALKDIAPKRILDVATGTGDLAIDAMRLKPEEVVGVDISEGMLAIAKEKVSKKGLDKWIKLQIADCEDLQFPDNSFDALTCAFGVRNFENLKKGLEEMGRVVRPGGKVAIVELSRPDVFPIKQLYHLYFRHILPLLGKSVSKDKNAYSYLPESVAAFPEPSAFCQLLEESGFEAVKANRLTLGISTLYVGIKIA